MGISNRELKGFEVPKVHEVRLCSGISNRELKVYAGTTAALKGRPYGISNRELKELCCFLRLYLLLLECASQIEN